MSILAHTHVDRLPSLRASLARHLREVIAAYRRWLACRRAEAELREMDDRQLADIGITRGEIHQKVWSR